MENSGSGNTYRIKIEKGVEIPPNGAIKWHFDVMEPGDSFLVPDERRARSAASAMRKWFQRRGIKGYRPAYRRETKGSPEHRVWWSGTGE